MSNLTNEILEFFHIDVSDPESSLKTTPKSVDQFVSQPQYINTLDLQRFTRIVSILKNEGLIISVGTLPSEITPILNEVLVAPSYNPEVAKYGSYKFLTEGFLLITEYFTGSVRPIVIISNDDKPDIGTGFLLGNNHTIITARHVVEKAKLITLTNKRGEMAIVKEVIFPKDENIDIAIILVENDVFWDSKPFRVKSPEILEQVLTIGYPPIPGFDAFQLYEISSINNSYKFSNGQIIGKETAYLDGIEYFILNAKVKGGNSGSPVINKKGNMVGMVIQIPMDSVDRENIDKLGYGILTPSDEIRKYLGGGEKENDIISYQCENIENGFRILA